MNLISLFSLPYLMASIFLALIHISRGNIRMAPLIPFWSELSTLGHLMDSFLAFGLSALELVSSLSVMRYYGITYGCLRWYYKHMFL